MAPRVSVLVKPVEGGHQAVCQTRGCAEGPAGGVWKSGVHTVKAGAEDDARTHRQWHRRQRAVPAVDLPHGVTLTVTGEGNGRWLLEVRGTVNDSDTQDRAVGSPLDVLREIVAAIEATGGGA